MLGAAWQRCRVHFLRNVLARVPKGSAEMVAAAVRTIFAQPDAAAVAEQLHSIADKLGRQFPAVAGMLTDAEADLCAFATFPHAHWRKIWSTNPLERVNKEIKRRSNVVGIFPNEAAVVRLTGAVLLEVHDEWQIADRRYLSEASMALLTPATMMNPTGKEMSDTRTARRLTSSTHVDDHTDTLVWPRPEATDRQIRIAGAGSAIWRPARTPRGEPRRRRRRTCAGWPPTQHEGQRGLANCRPETSRPAAPGPSTASRRTARRAAARAPRHS